MELASHAEASNLALTSYPNIQSQIVPFRHSPDWGVLWKGKPNASQNSSMQGITAAAPAFKKVQHVLPCVSSWSLQGGVEDIRS